MFYYESENALAQGVSDLSPSELEWWSQFRVQPFVLSGWSCHWQVVARANEHFIYFDGFNGAFAVAQLNGARVTNVVTATSLSEAIRKLHPSRPTGPPAEEPE